MTIVVRVARPLRRWQWIALVQSIMYALSIGLAFRMLDRFQAGMIGRNVLLLLLGCFLEVAATLRAHSGKIQETDLA